jgi:hypothetical protein
LGNHCLQRLEEGLLFQELAFKILVDCSFQLTGVVGWCIQAGGSWCISCDIGDFIAGNTPTNLTGNLRLGNTTFQAS